MEGLSSPIDFASLKKCSELETMEYSGMQQGTLFKLTKSEYDFILDMIREDNPISDGKEKAAYLKQNFLNDVYITEAKYDRLTAVLKKKRISSSKEPQEWGKPLQQKGLLIRSWGKQMMIILNLCNSIRSIHMRIS